MTSLQTSLTAIKMTRTQTYNLVLKQMTFNTFYKHCIKYLKKCKNMYRGLTNDHSFLTTKMKQKYSNLIYMYTRIIKELNEYFYNWDYDSFYNNYDDYKNYLQTGFNYFKISIDEIKKVDVKKTYIDTDKCQELEKEIDLYHNFYLSDNEYWSTF